MLVDKGYRGHAQVGSAAVIMPGKKTHVSDYARRKHKRLCKRRSGIEALIGHLKSDHRLRRNYLKGSSGDAMNALLAGMGFNLMLMIRELSGHFLFFMLEAFFCPDLPRRTSLAIN